MLKISALVTERKEVLAECFRQGIARAKEVSSPVVVSVAQSLPWDAGPLATFAAMGGIGNWRTLWGRPERCFWLAGLGRAVTLASNGSHALGEVAGAHRSVLAAAVIHGHGPRGTGPVFLGGFRYDVEAIRDSFWDGFPDALLALPHLLFTWSGGETWLTVSSLIASETDPEEEARAAMAQVAALRTVPCAQAAQPQVIELQQTSRDEWTSWVRQALQDIAAGRVTKVVLARRKVLLAQRPFSLETALGRTSEAYPECSMFAIDNGEASFVAATPEALVHIDNGLLRLSCLAGTIGRGANTNEDRELCRQLLNSHKDRLEHAVVVAAVAETLKQVCMEVHRDEEPGILTLRTVHHLRTAFTGRLQAGATVLDLVRRLHPTPAVGGAPREAALGIIRRSEGDRGWYAAPVGWLGPDGEGEFSVAIRSALLRGDRAALFAGSGIVKGSDPDREFEETELKFQTLLSVLGQGWP